MGFGDSRRCSSDSSGDTGTAGQRVRWGRCHSEPGGREAGSQCKHKSHFKMDFGVWTTKCPPNQRAALLPGKGVAPESGGCQGCLSLGGHPWEQPRGQTGCPFPAPSKVTHRHELTPAGRAERLAHSDRREAPWRQEWGVWDPQVLPGRMRPCALEPLLAQEGVLGPVGGPGPESGQGQRAGSRQEGGQ